MFRFSQSTVGRLACLTPNQRQTAFDKQNALQKSVITWYKILNIRYPYTEFALSRRKDKQNPRNCQGYTPFLPAGIIFLGQSVIFPEKYLLIQK